MEGKYIKSPENFFSHSKQIVPFVPNFIFLLLYFFFRKKRSPNCISFRPYKTWIQFCRSDVFFMIPIEKSRLFLSRSDFLIPRGVQFCISHCQTLEILWEGKSWWRPSSSGLDRFGESALGGRPKTTTLTGRTKGESVCECLGPQARETSDNCQIPRHKWRVKN